MRWLRSVHDCVRLASTFPPDPEKLQIFTALSGYHESNGTAPPGDEPGDRRAFRV